MWSNAKTGRGSSASKGESPLTISGIKEPLKAGEKPFILPGVKTRPVKKAIWLKNCVHGKERRGILN